MYSFVNKIALIEVLISRIIKALHSRIKIDTAKFFLIKFKKIKNLLLISYTISLIILCVFFIVDFRSGIIRNEKKLINELLAFKEFPFQTISTEIFDIFNLLEMLENKKSKHDFLKENLHLTFSRNYRILEHEQKKSTVEIHDEVLSITRGYHTVEIDIISLSNFVTKSIPKYIGYNFDIHNKVIVEQENDYEEYLKEKITDNKHKTNITFYVTKKYSDEYSKNYLSQKLSQIIFIIVPILTTNIIFLFLYVRNNRIRFKDTCKEKSKLLIEKTILDKHLQIKKKYNSLIISELRSVIYRAILNKDDTVDEIMQYPVLIQNNAYANIECKKYFRDILSYFEYYAFNKKIDLQYTANQESFKIKISELSFYQISISIFYNLLSLSENGRVFKLDFFIKNETLESIVVTYNSFALTQDQMKNFTKNNNIGEVFLLDISQVINALKLYNISHEIENNLHSQQILRLKMNNKTTSTSFDQEKGNIINLKDYHVRSI